MILDMQGGSSPDVFSYPDWIFSLPARPDTDIREQENLTGSSQTTVFLTGTADQTPASNPGGSS